MHHCIVWKAVKNRLPESHKKTLKLSLEFQFTILGVQDKSLWKEVIGNIISKYFTFIRPMWKWTRTVNIQQTALLVPAPGILYVIEATGCISYTQQTASINKMCDTIYRRQAQIEHPPKCRIISSIKHTRQYYVGYQGEEGTVSLDKRTPQFLEDIFKYW